MLQADDNLLKELFKEMPRDKRGEVAPGSKPYYSIPVFSLHGESDKYLSSFYQRQYIDSAQRFVGEVPQLSEIQVKALNLFDQIADDPKLVFTMEFKKGV